MGTLVGSQAWTMLSSGIFVLVALAALVEARESPCSGLRMWNMERQCGLRMFFDGEMTSHACVVSGDGKACVESKACRRANKLYPCSRDTVAETPDEDDTKLPLFDGGGYFQKCR